MKKYEVYLSVTTSCKTVVGAENEQEAIKKVNQGSFYQWEQISKDQHYDAHHAKEID